MLILFDIDGVLTDGAVYISEGKETKRITYQDIDAIFALKRAGHSIGFISGEEGEFTRYVQERFLPDYFLTGCKDKLCRFLDLHVREEKICFVGDSKHDIGLLKHVDLSFCPADSHDTVKGAVKFVARAKRGEGVIAEVAEFILKDVFTDRVDEHLAVIEKLKGLRGTIKEAADIIIQALQAGNKLLICGNGGSAADAQHIETELVSRFLCDRKAIHAEALTTNTSSLTAIANDYDFTQVFARQVEAKGKPGDVLLAISTSGKSVNIVEALIKAKEEGLKTILLTGDSLMCGDVTIRVPSDATPRIQEAHILIAHMICEYIEVALC
ncbi:MAG: SIS domain-containing protein [Candidatus Aenigmarchaeota archaeon]|nr:SIS domain-containing protein [Candidatus Aenigmarchaeota archaeon]